MRSGDIQTLLIARVLARSGVAMLYAHWEGFVKEACQFYVDYVAKRRLRCNELNDGFLRTMLLGWSKRAMAGDEISTAALMEAVLHPADSRARIPKNVIVETRSNLRFNVLSEIFAGIGFPTDKFMTRDKLIDKTLCEGRNGIAHSRNYYPGAGSFDDLYQEVLEMMEDLQDLVLASVRMQQYRRQVSNSSEQ